MNPLPESNPQPAPNPKPKAKAKRSPSKKKRQPRAAPPRNPNPNPKPHGGNAISSSEPTAAPDAFAAALDAQDGKTGPTPQTPAPIANTGGPWPNNGKKYPLALDFKGDASAASYNAWLDELTGTPGLAGKCLVGESFHATSLYYGQSLDVHPLAQLAGAGLAFGFGMMMARAKAEKDDEANETPATTERAGSLLDKIDKARGATDQHKTRKV